MFTEELMTIADRIGKKSVAIDGDKRKVENLHGQIKIYEYSIEKTEDGIKKKEEELESLTSIQKEALALVTKVTNLAKYTDELRDRFSAIEWSPDLAWEDKIESTDYHEKIAEKFAAIEEIERLVKKANKIYYRR